MDRRKFLYQMGILGATLLTPNYLYSTSENAPDKYKNKKERDFSLNILNNKANFNYKGKIKLEDWAMELKNKDVGYIVEKSKKLLESKYDSLSRNKVLDTTPENFRKIITANPYFIIPLATEILTNQGKIHDRVSVGATIEDNGLEKGLWYVEKNGMNQVLKGMVTIPYADDENILIYGKGIKWGVEGEFVSLMNYKKIKDKVDLSAHFFVKSSGTGFFSSLAAGLAPGVITKRVGDNAMRLVDIPEMLVDSLNLDKTLIKKYGNKEISYLEKLLE